MNEFAAGERLPEKHTRTLEELFQKILAYHPQADISVIQKAYDFSEKAHEGQIRRSGEAYISHPLSVAGILADLRLDLDSIATGLLHDTVEDTHATIADIKREFGDSVAQMVDGVTKISKMNFKTSTERQGENIRKMIVAMGKDVRVILVKLCDRLHNMRTLNHMAYDKQARIALETLEIYCPLASRLGISSLKIELEDLSFRYYRPDMYYQLSQKVTILERDQASYIDEVKKLISKNLEATHSIRKYEVQGRSKHLWSIYRKMTNRNIDFEQVYDVLAFRVLVESISQCYEVLGLVHSIWKPIPGRFKDFIAMPKTNNYQSLHTTVIGPGGERIEIQIRTMEMNLIAERGIAAHWKYKERGKVDDDTARKFDWLKDLLNWQQTVRNPDEFLDTVKTDLFESEIYVFTPKGDVKEFPEGSTPLDFAYSVHTDVGHKCVGARINGKMVPLKYRMKNGDTIEIITSTNQVPSKDWLKICVTNRAKSKIRAFVKEEQRKRSLIFGKELVDREFRKFGAAASRYLGKGEEWEKLLKDFGLHNEEEVYIRVGYGKMEPRHLVERLAPGIHTSVPSKEKEDEKPSFMQKILKNAQQKSKKSGSLVSVSGMDDVLVYYAKCCNPIPGDTIVGFITRGRGITVHRSDCRKAFEFDQDRKVDVEWTAKSASEGAERLVKIQVFSQDVQGLLKLMSEVFSAQGMNIQNANVRTTRDQKAVATFEVTVRNTAQLSQVVQDLQKIRGVLEVTRLTDS